MDNALDNTSPSVQVSKAEEDASAKDSDLVASWVKELALSVSREKDFRKVGKEVVAIYECEGRSQKENQFNILYSNTETLAPALYNSTPRPICERRFKDEDELGKVSAQACQRVLEFLIDPGRSEYTPFDTLMESAVLEALLPGRGVTWFKYEPTWKDDSQSEVVSETVCGEAVPWDRFRHGYGKTWAQVPWCAWEMLLTKEEVEEKWGEAIANELEYPEVQEIADDETSSGAGLSDNSTKGAKLAQVFQIWDKATKEVLFIAPCYVKAPLQKLPDPLKLQGFFPCPTPMKFMAKVSSLTPVSLYKTYMDQAKELNRVTMRINKLVEACKVRGLYDSTIDGLKDVLTSADNVLTPVDNVAALVANGMTLDKSVWLVPIEKIITVLQQLYLAREQIKKTIYEITGIADIMRGSSQASETLGAQEIKNQWGTLRLKRSQKVVMNYVRESLRIMAEIAVSKFSPETLSAMTGLPWPTGSQKANYQTQAALLTAQGQPVPEEVQAVLAAPSWDDILGLLRNDITRSYRIDIETNSTVDAEATEDKQNITDLVNAMAQFMNGIAPLIESGSMPFEVAKQMLLTIVRRYRFGPEMEDSLKAMTAPQPKADPKAASEQLKAQGLQQKAQLDQQAAQQKLQQDQQKFEGDKAKFQAEMAGKQQERAEELQQARDLAQLELQVKHEELEFKRREMAMKADQMERDGERSRQEHLQNLQSIGMKGEADRATTQAKIKEARNPAKPAAAAPAPAAKPAEPQDLAPLIKALQSGLESMGKELGDSIAKAVSAPRKAVKGKDGSWSSQSA